jgi:hypothetical protein
MSQTIVDKRNQFQKWNKQSILTDPQKIIKCILFYIIKLKIAILLILVCFLIKMSLSILI